jgi:hypothetical protein
MSAYRCGQSHEFHARRLVEFLYIDGKGKNGFKEHTIDEYRKEIEDIINSCFEEYNLIISELE